MASVEKYTAEAVEGILKHDCRTASSYSNKDIDEDRTYLNYSFDTSHEGTNDYEYYKQVLENNYMFSKGTQREKETVTAAGWVITLPKEITGDKEKEDRFFEGVYQFVSERYREENIVNNAVHYDEGGQPHIHVVFVPVTEIDHDQIHYKTIKSKTAVKLDTGRYEYEYRYKLQDGTTIPVKDYEIKDGIDQRIPIKNYSRRADQYTTKISGADVLNKAELQHFGPDLQSYLSENGIEGKVVTGTTGGINIPVKQLKDITKSTGLTIDEIKEKMTIEEINHAISSGKDLNVSIKEVIDRNVDLNEQISILNNNLDKEKKLNDSLKAELSNTRYELEQARIELEQTREMNESNEEKNLRVEEIEDWTRNTSWGASNDWTRDYEEEREW